MVVMQKKWIISELTLRLEEDIGNYILWVAGLFWTQMTTNTHCESIFQLDLFSSKDHRWSDRTEYPSRTAASRAAEDLLHFLVMTYLLLLCWLLSLLQSRQQGSKLLSHRGAVPDRTGPALVLFPVLSCAFQVQPSFQFRICCVENSGQVHGCSLSLQGLASLSHVMCLFIIWALVPTQNPLNSAW